MTKIKEMTVAGNDCPHCKGTGTRLDRPKVGFQLAVGDIVEDHVGMRVRVDQVWSEDNTVGWGTTLNAPEVLPVTENHNYHRIETDNHTYTKSLWTKVQGS